MHTHSSCSSGDEIRTFEAVSIDLEHLSSERHVLHLWHQQNIFIGLRRAKRHLPYRLESIEPVQYRLLKQKSQRLDSTVDIATLDYKRWWCSSTSPITTC